MFDNALRARDLVKQRLPDLRVGPGKTKNSALHHLVFAGTLEEWPNFEEHVWRACRNHAWGPRILAHQSTGRPKTYIPTRELVAVGDEHGLQGRFDQHVGQVMSGILESEGIDLVFGDFKCSSEDYERVPDVALFDNAGLLKAIGELKTLWVRAHDLEAALRSRNRKSLRKLLG